MPTSLGSLVFFVALPVPGFVYLARTETKLPGRDFTVLREMSTVVSASLVADVFAVGVFLLGSWLVPGGLDEVGDLLKEPNEYLDVHPIGLVAWGSALLLTAVSFAAFVAVPPAWCERLPNLWVQQEVSRRRRASIVQESGWVKAFNRYPERRVHLGSDPQR